MNNFTREQINKVKELETRFKAISKELDEIIARVDKDTKILEEMLDEEEDEDWFALCVLNKNK